MTTLTATASTSPTPIQSHCDCQPLRRPAAERVLSPPEHSVRSASDGGAERSEEPAVTSIEELGAFRIV